MNMRKAVFLFLLCLPLLSCSSKYTTIKGIVYNEDLETVVLYQTVDGRKQQYATTRVNEDGSYGFALNPEAPGFYSVGSEDGMDFMIYLQGGEEVNIDLYETKATLNGKNTKENEALYVWEDYAANIRLKSVYFAFVESTYEDFFPEFEDFVEGQNDLKKNLKSGNEAFDEALLKLVGYETDFYAIRFVTTPRMKHPERSMYPEYYNHIFSEDKFTTDDVLQFSWGAAMMDSYAGYAYLYFRPEEGTDYWDYTMSYLPNEHLKGEYIIKKFETFGTYDKYLETMEKYGKYLITPSLKKQAEARGSELYARRPGAPAVDFTYPDTEGKIVSLSDFRGKVVLIDVWATWCGPCREELPHLKKLEKEMHGKDVVFMSISVDAARDKLTWLDFIEEEQLGGVQLLAAEGDVLKKVYNVTSIPHFIVISKDGKIVSARAPRPSEPELKEMLEAELAK